METTSIHQIALELNENYREALELKKEFGFEKNEKSKIFSNILKMLFAKYGVSFGYSNLSSFKSDVIWVQRRIKKEKKKEKEKRTPLVLVLKKNCTEKDGQLKINF